MPSCGFVFPLMSHTSDWLLLFPTLDALPWCELASLNEESKYLAALPAPSGGGGRAKHRNESNTHQPDELQVMGV